MPSNTNTSMAIKMSEMEEKIAREIRRLKEIQDRLVARLEAVEIG